MNKTKEIQQKINELQKELNSLEDIGKVSKAINDATEGVVERKGYSGKYHIKIRSPINFGYYRGVEKFDKLAKEILPELGVYIEHHDDPFGDDFDVSFLTFDLEKDKIEEGIKAAKLLMPKLNVSYTKTVVY